MRSEAWKLPAGDLKHRLEIQRETVTRDEVGGIIQTWATIATVWGGLRQMTGGELMHARAVHARATHRIIIRRYEGLTPKDRMKFGSRYFNLIEVATIEERNKLMVCTAIEMVE